MVIRIGRKASFLAAIAGAAIIGGATTAMVSAAIPSTADDKIRGCYRNNANLFQPKGNLRVINSDNGEQCNGQETALNWQGTGTVPPSDVQYAYFKRDPNTSKLVLDTSRSNGVVDVQVAGEDIPNVTEGALCVSLAATPRTVIVQPLDNGGGEMYEFKTQGGWTNVNSLTEYCDSLNIGSNVVVTETYGSIVLIAH